MTDVPKRPAYRPTSTSSSGTQRIWDATGEGGKVPTALRDRAAAKAKTKTSKRSK